MIRPLLIAALLGLIGGSAAAGPLTVEGTLGWEFRIYPGDAPGRSAESTLGGEVTLRGRQGPFRWQVAPRLWVDPADADRFRWMPREAWAETRLGSFRFRAGRDVLTWGSGDARKPTDILGAADPGWDFLEPQKRGEWMASVTASTERAGLEVVLLPVLDGITFPGPRSAWSLQAAARRVGASGDQVRLLEDRLTPGNMSEASVGARLRWSVATTDMHLVGLYGLDRTPVLWPDTDCPDLAGCLPTRADVSDLYPPLRLGGVEIQAAPAGFVFRVEAAYRDQHTTDSTFAARTEGLADISRQLVIGTERVWSGFLGPGDLRAGVELLLDDASAASSNIFVFRPFQRDLAVSLAWSLNDFSGTRIEAGWIQDLERPEGVATFRVHRRLTPKLVVAAGADVLYGPTPRSLPELANPFYLFSANDRAILELRYGF